MDRVLPRFPSRLVALACALAVGGVPAAHRAAAQTAPTADRAGVSGPLGERIHELASRTEAYGYSGQVLVTVDGRPVIHEAYGFADPRTGRPMTLDTPVGIASISKQFLGAAILTLVEAGRLTLDDSLPLFFEDVPDDKRSITLRQLMSHRAGVRSAYSEDFEPSTKQALVRGILESPLFFEPGQDWRYSAAAYNLLAAVVEEVTGLDYAVYLRRALFDPAGLDHTRAMSVTSPSSEDDARAYLGWYDRGVPVEWPRNWRNFGAGDLLSTAGDLYRWERAVTAGRVLGEEALARYFKPLAPIDDELGYGFGLVIRDSEGSSLIEHGGDAALGYNGSFYRYPDEGFVVLVTSNARTAGGEFLRHALGLGIEQILRGESAELPPPGRLPTAADVRTLPGRYELEGGGLLLVHTDGARLWVSAEGQPAVDLLAGAGPDERAAAERANRKAAALFGGLHASDSTAYVTALGEDGAPYLSDYLGEWRNLVESRGPLHRFEVLGSLPGRGSVTTRTRLEFRSGPVTLTSFWGDEGRGRVGGTFLETVPYRPAIALALARSGDGFTAHDLFRDRSLAVTIGEAGDLRVSDGESVATARRVGPVGWVPAFR